MGSRYCLWQSDFEIVILTQNRVEIIGNDWGRVSGPEKQSAFRQDEKPDGACGLSDLR